MNYEIHDSAHDVIGRLECAVVDGDQEALEVIEAYSKYVRDRSMGDVREFWWNVYSSARNAKEGIVSRLAGNIAAALRSEELSGMFEGDARKLRLALRPVDLNADH